MVHVHIEAPTEHIHKDGHGHDHSGANSNAKPGGDQHSMAIAFNGKAAREKAPHSSDGQCCGLTCVTALPATLIDVVTPSAAMAVCEAERYREVTDNAPSSLYRPPIS